jgi:chloramphenicol 3-O phosphotransferase
MESGHVIFLNGTSSSGKTTIAKALQNKLPEPYMYVSIDGFFSLYPERILDPSNQEEADILVRLFPAVVTGFHKSVAALARSGNNIIVDHVLQEDGWLKECVENWAGLDVLFVGVKCPLEITEQREKDRSDRKVGTARYQFERVHNHDLYDLEIDTSILSVEECVEKVMELINHKPVRKVFQDLADKIMVNGNTILRSEAG